MTELAAVVQALCALVSTACARHSSQPGCRPAGTHTRNAKSPRRG